MKDLKTILIVDDNPELLTCLKELLIRFGHRVLPVFDARSALDVILSESAIDLIITDYQMPCMNGLQLAEILRNSVPSVPVIMCSACADPDLTSKARAVGVAAFVEKPFNLQVFRQVVADLLEVGSCKAGSQFTITWKY